MMNFKIFHAAALATLLPLSLAAAQIRPRLVPPTGLTPAGLAAAKLGTAPPSMAKAGAGASLTKMPATLCGGSPPTLPTNGTTVTGDTSDLVNSTNILNGYLPAGIVPFDEGGREVVYQFNTATTGDIRIFVQPNRVPFVDVDIILLGPTCDTTKAIAYGDFAAVALNQPPGTYYVVIDTPGYGTAPGPYTYYPGVFKVTAAVSAGILLVDDDGSGDTTQCTPSLTGCPDTQAAYTTALNTAGIGYTVYDVAASGPLSLATMSRYKTLIWFTGGSYQPGKTLTAADQTNLKMFQDLGGRTLITGQDIFFDLLNGVNGRVPDGSVLNDHFQITSVANDIDIIPGAGACPTNSILSGTLSISGTITDQAGFQLFNQRICFDGGPGKRGSVLSGAASGAYTIANLPPGTYNYWLPVGSGTAPSTRQTVLVAGNSTLNDFVVQANPWRPGRTLTGIPGNPISSDITTGAQQTLNLGAVPFGPFTDALTSRYGQPIFYTADHRPAGFLFDSSVFSLAPHPYAKSIFLAFAPELDATAGRLQTLLTRAVNWLNNDSDYCPSGITVGAYNFEEVETFTDGAIVNGYPDPGETVTYHLQVINHDTGAHTFKIGLAAQQTYVTQSPPTFVTTASVPAAGSATANFTMTLGPNTSIRTGETLNRSYNIEVGNATGTVFNYCHSTGFGSFVGQANVMLVKDEGILPNTTGVDVYTSAFKTLGSTYALWDTAVFGHPPYGATAGYLNNEIMTPYNSVVWFTGFDYAGTLLPAFTGDRNAETDLGLLLNAPSGRLFLSSQDYLFDRYKGLSQDIPAADFSFTQLKLAHVNQDIIKDNISNVAAEPGVWATEAAYNTLATTYFNNFADGTLLRTGVSGARQLAHWAASGFPTGSVRLCIAGTDCGATSTNGLKMVFMPYAFENLADGGGASNKQRMLEKILCQFQTTNTTPPCGYSRPAPYVDTVTIMPEKPAGIPDFYWSDPGRFACNGDAIVGPWRVFGATTPSGAQAFLRNSTNANPASTPASESPATGTGEFYTVPSFVDDFGTAPVASCP